MTTPAARPSRRTLLAGAGGLALTGALTASLCACGGSPGEKASAPASGGLPRTSSVTTARITVASRTSEGRLDRWRVRTDVLPGEVGVNILRPTGYDASPTRRYPVLYLLHGSESSAQSWANARIDEVLGDAQVIAVMPDGGAEGWYLDWVADNPRTWWETFHVRGLVPSIDAAYRTRARPGGRGVVGYSMGGFGAVHYAQAYPDVFGAVTSLSGAISLRTPQDFAAIDSQTLADKPAGAIFGTTGAVERADRVDPVQHVALLTGRRVRLYCGDGSRQGQSPDPLETTLLAGNRVFQDAAVAAGVDCTLTVLPGGHDFGTWLPALAKDLPGLLRALGPPE